LRGQPKCKGASWPWTTCHLGVEPGTLHRVLRRRGRFRVRNRRWRTRIQAHRKEGKGQRQSTKGLKDRPGLLDFGNVIGRDNSGNFGTLASRDASRNPQERLCPPG